MKEQKKAKSLIDQYRVINPKGYLEIEETINREHGKPNQLQLYGIYDDGELIYKEKIPDSANARLKASSQKKYCFNQHSFLTNYFFMSEQSRYLFFFRKFTFCRHKYSCFEHIIRTVYKTLGLYLMIRIGAEMVAGNYIHEIFSNLLNKFSSEPLSEQTIRDWGLGVEVNSLVFLNLFMLRRCFYSFILEAQAD